MIHHLQLEVDYSFYSLGISCHVKEYKMAWLLNKCLNTRLEFMDPIIIHHKSGESVHSIYQFTDDEARVCISLISNRSKKGYLLPEFPQTDFILKIEEAEEGEFQELRASIRKMNQVLLVHTIDPSSIKSGVNLVF